MALGIAHRRTKPSMEKINVYRKRSWRASRWGTLPPLVQVENQPTGSSQRRKLRVLKQASSGNLMSGFPLEITIEILFELDLMSLGNLRRLNSHFKDLVESIPAYRLLNQHAPQTLKVIYMTGVSSAITLRQLFTAFNEPSCQCGSFAPFIFLPTVSRACEDCLQEEDDFQMLPLSAVSSCFAIPPRVVKKNLPVVYSPGGTYGHHRESYFSDRSIHLVSVKQVESLAIQIHGSFKSMREAVRHNRRESRLRYKSKVLRWSISQEASPHNPSKRKPSSPRCLSFPYKLKNSLLATRWRCRGATDFPFWDAQKKRAESGVYCSACCYYKCFERIGLTWQPTAGPEGNTVAFTLDAIPQHFEDCEFVKKGYTPGGRYKFYNDELLGLDFLVDENGEEIDQDPDINEDVPERYISPLLKELSRENTVMKAGRERMPKNIKKARGTN